MNNHTDLYLVGGFLGSGKTTAIIEASRQLISRGVKVGVITNDQGKYLVDTAFFKLESIPAVEVTGGCFCCNYDDLNEHILQLIAELSPDVIFAESVGSCADIVATVIKPLLTLGANTIQPTNFSVFVDGRLLSIWLEDLPMPFSEDVVYIFEQQMQEGGLLVVNKQDLLTPEELDLIQAALPERFPGKPFILQNSMESEEVNNWVKILQEHQIALPEHSLDIDYGRYGQGEARMAWLDQSVDINLQHADPNAVLLALLREVLAGLSEKGYGVGHLKFVVSCGEVRTKISFTQILEPGWEAQLPDLSGDTLNLLVNARVEGSADELRRVIEQALSATEARFAIKLRESEIAFFHPGVPQPVHRFT